MKLPRVVYEQIKVHAIRSAPQECCGILAIQGDEAICAYKAANVHAEPTQAYLIDEEDQVRILQEIGAMGLGFAVYHSHPTSNHFPSRRDNDFSWPGSLHFIIGMDSGLTIGAWWLGGGAFQPETLEIVA